MKKMNHPMPLLPAWQPRPPASGLKQRIFTARRSEPEHKLHLLVPAMACMVLSLVVLNSNGSLAPAGLKHSLMADMILSNQNYSACAAADSQNPQNHLESLSFGWTNHSASTTFTGFTQSTN